MIKSMESWKKKCSPKMIILPFITQTHVSPNLYAIIFCGRKSLNIFKWSVAPFSFNGWNESVTAWGWANNDKIEISTIVSFQTRTRLLCKSHSICNNSQSLILDLMKSCLVAECIRPLGSIGPMTSYHTGFPSRS